MRQNEFYEDNVLRLKEFFPAKELLNVGDVAKFAGLDRRTVEKRYPFTSGYITVATLARALCRQ